MKSCKIKIFFLAVVLFVSLRAAAQDGEKLSYTNYYFNDSGGNSVVTNSLNFAKKIFHRTMVLLDLELDNVYVPPVDGVSGATRPSRQKHQPFEKTRAQAIVGIEQGFDRDTRLAVNLYRSQEVDYLSHSVIGTFTREMFHKNTTLVLRGQYIQDEVGKILDNGDLVNRSKWAGWIKIGLGQVLSPVATLDLSYDLLYQNGFLSDPYRQVKVFDENFVFRFTEERHPIERTRHALSASVKQYLTALQASLGGGYRFYLDDWEVRSHTLEMQFSKYVFDDLITRFNYRYYTQSGAYFSQPRYQGARYLSEALRTADYKLQPFNSNNFGLSLTYLLRGLAARRPALGFLGNSSLEVRYFRYFNTLDFSANIFQLNVNLGI